MKGKFIVFEGIDGCGKGTQIKLAVSYLFDLSKENDVYVTREPTRDFKEIRIRMAEGTDVKQDAEWYAGAFVTDRRNHVQKYIQPAIDLGIHVLSDRYKHSTLAYQQTQGIELDTLVDMHHGLIVPDLTLIFDCPADVAFRRRKQEGATEVFDKDIVFQEQLRHNYTALPEQFLEERIVVVDSTPSIEIVFEQVKKEIDKIL